MKLVVKHPSHRLTNVVDFFWFAEGISDYSKGIGIPQPRMGIVFNLGGPHKLLGRSRKDDVNYDKFWVQGYMNQSIKIETGGISRMIGVKFHPEWAALAFKIPLIEFYNQQIQGDLVWGNKINSVREQLLEQENIPAMFEILQSFLVSQLTPARFTRRVPVENIIHKIRSQKGNISIAELCKAYSVSRKHLVHVFNQHAGLSPKEYACLCRFEHASSILFKQPEKSLTEISCELDFFDQAHFIKEFQSYSSFTPGEYTRIKKATPNFLPLTTSDLRPAV